MTQPDLLVEEKENVLWLTIHREHKRNAMNHEVLYQLTHHITAAQHQTNIRAIVLTGAGDSAFCSGVDLAESPFSSEGIYGRLAQVFRAIKMSSIPMIARINGTCLAGGMGLMAMCDLVAAKESATFGLPEIKLGLFPAQVLAYLQRQLPPRLLTKMCLDGQPITSPQALACGLINLVSNDVDDALQSLLQPLLQGAPAAQRRGLYCMKNMQDMTFDQRLAFAESQIALFAESSEATEGIAAFLEKRPPNWLP